MQFFTRPDGRERLIPDVIMEEPDEGDYVLVSRFSGIDAPTFAASTIEVRPGMDAVVDAVAGIAYIKPTMLTGDGQELSTGSGSIRDPRTGERLSYGFTTRRYYPIVNGVRGNKSAVSGKFGPIPAGEYEMVLQVGGAVHRERIMVEPDDDYRPKVVIDPIVTARVEVIDDRGQNLNDGYQTYVGSCAVEPRDADGNLTGCGSWGISSITQARGATFFRPGPQVVVFRSDYANVRAEQVVDIPADATSDSFTITTMAGQRAEVGEAESSSTSVDPTVDPAPVPDPTPDPTPDPIPAPTPPVFGTVIPTLPERVFVRVHDGAVGDAPLNGSRRGQPTSAGTYEGTWIYRAEDLVAPDATTRPFVEGDGVTDGAIPAEHGGGQGGEPGPAGHATVATAGTLPEGD